MTSNASELHSVSAAVCSTYQKGACQLHMQGTEGLWLQSPDAVRTCSVCVFDAMPSLERICQSTRVACIAGMHVVLIVLQAIQIKYELFCRRGSYGGATLTVATLRSSRMRMLALKPRNYLMKPKPCCRYSDAS